MLNPHASFNISNGRSTKNVLRILILTAPFPSKYRRATIVIPKWGLPKTFEILDAKADLGFQTLQRYDSLGHQYSYSIVDFTTQLQSKDSSKVYVPREFQLETDFFHEATLSEQKCFQYEASWNSRAKFAA